ncbi:MAG: hypothetical protein SGPRY_010590 [Prymnesium sp.]
MEEAMPRVVAGGKGSEAVAAAATKADPARDQRESLAARLLSLSFLHAGGCNAGCARSTSSTLSYGEGCSASTCWVQDQLVARCQPLPPRKQGRRDEAPAVLTLQHSLATVFELPIDLKPLQAVRHVFEHLKKDPTSTRHLLFAPKRLRFHVERPSWKSDIRWISARDELTFGWFAAQFEKLRIRKMLAFLGELVLFSGFIVARQVTSKSYFHTDFDNSGGKAFTLMTPVYDMTSLASCHLVCEDGSALKQYRYSLGRASEAIAYTMTFLLAWGRNCLQYVRG